MYYTCYQSVLIGSAWIDHRPYDNFVTQTLSGLATYTKHKLAYGTCLCLSYQISVIKPMNVLYWTTGKPTSVGQSGGLAKWRTGSMPKRTCPCTCFMGIKFNIEYPHQKTDKSLDITSVVGYGHAFVLMLNKLNAQLCNCQEYLPTDHNKSIL